MLKCLQCKLGHMTVLGLYCWAFESVTRQLSAPYWSLCCGYFCICCHTHLFDVFVLVDARREGGGEAFIDVRLGCQLLQGLHAVLGEELLLGLLVQAVKTPLVRLAEVDGIYVRLVDGLHVALPWVDAHGDRSVDTCGDIWGALRI